MYVLVCDLSFSLYSASVCSYYSVFIFLVEFGDSVDVTVFRFHFFIFYWRMQGCIVVATDHRAWA